MIKRAIEEEFLNILQCGKSVLLLGPRQTGKTTLIQSVPCDLYLVLAQTQIRRRFEMNPDLIIQEVDALRKRTPLIIIDEIQKVPMILDAIQTLIDAKKARFVLTGSSARKLRRQAEINLLPGRVVALRMDPFSNEEFAQSLDEHLLYGSLPGIALQNIPKAKNMDLRTYVDVYLEEEVRAEAIVRNLPAFYRFLEMAALEAGKIVSFNAISQTLGVAHTTVSGYYQVLEDCLIVERISPLFESASRKKLTKSSKYLFFDMGVRRFAAQEGVKLGLSRKGELFEHFVGLELLRGIRKKNATQLLFWRDPDGPEVDWVLKSNREFLPIEVKYSANAKVKDCKHIQTFMQEYPCPLGGVVICQTPRPFKIAKNITAHPWQEIPKILSSLE